MLQQKFVRAPIPCLPSNMILVYIEVVTRRMTQTKQAWKDEQRY